MVFLHALQGILSLQIIVSIAYVLARKGWFSPETQILLPRLVEELPRFLPFVTSESTGGVLTTFQLQTMLYGVLIVVFLIAEPRGLFGIWVRARNYWNAWPFSY